MIFAGTPAGKLAAQLPLSNGIQSDTPSPSDSSVFGNAQRPSSQDCSDPLLANSAACSGQLTGENNPYTNPQSVSSFSGLSPNIGAPLRNPASNYSDIEDWSRQNGTQNQQLRPPLPPQPLTEFQKFVASTTGEILPIYGSDLFRRVPSTFAPLNRAPVPPDYVIGPGDELRIRVWGQVNLQSNVRVDRSGDIYLPQVGPVQVAGLPYSALEEHVRDAVKTIYRNFDLTVDVGQIRSIQVYVTGAARSPGLYTVSSLSTLVDTLFESGGPSIEGSLRRIELRRGGTVITTFDLYDLLLHGDKSKDSKLLDGDVIFIPPVGPQAALVGSVHNPAIYELLRGETLGGLIADAGGASSVAAGARVSIERIDAHRDRHAMEAAYDTAGLATVVEDGDLIRILSIVPKYQKTVTLRGNTANPGRFAWHPGMRLSELIPDKESLLTRNYWWQRAKLGLPAPEFEPIVELSAQHQPFDDQPSSLEPPSRRDQNSGETTELPETGSPYPRGATQLDQAQNTSEYPQSETGSFPQDDASMQESQPGSVRRRPLNGEQRAGHATLASEDGMETDRDEPAWERSRRNKVKLLAPDIDWSYAVIERLEPETLRTTLIPFDLGRLVLEHDAAQDLALQPGDVVTIFSQADIRVPTAEQTKLVTLQGEFVHAGIYSVRPGETLRDLVQRAGGLTPNADLYGSEFTRESTRVMQQARIDEYIQNLNLDMQRSALALQTLPVASASDSASAAAAQTSERTLLAALRRIRATGRVVLGFGPVSSGTATIPPIALENGDLFTVPPVPATVNVVGAVYDQNSFLYKPDRRLGAYLQLAGGPNRSADRKHAFVIRADGEVVSYAMSNGLWGNQFNDLRINPGDTIVVPEKTLKPSALRGILEWSQLFSQFALGAAAISVIQ